MVPGYEVCEEIARGGMGTVLVARDLSLDREVAIKVLLPDAVLDAGRFLQEARITARLPHPGVPPVYALGELPDGRPFLAMKLIKGRTLATILATRRGRRTAGLLTDSDLTAPSAPGLLQVFEQLCQTVAFAHANGIIHRDLKPSNVMVGAFGEVQVMDWGLAKEVQSTEHAARSPKPAPINPPFTPYPAPRSPHPEEVTATGAILGTPAYIAPEQARGQPVDERADVFALGGILCAILTGRPPFEGGDAAGTLNMAAVGDVSRALERLAGCQADAELIGITVRCLSPHPRGRPLDAGVLAAEVAAYRAGVEERLRTAETERAAAAARAEDATRRAEAEAAKAAEQRRQARWQLMTVVTMLVMIGLLLVMMWSADHRQARDDADRRVEEAVREALLRAKDRDDTGAGVPNGCSIPLPREVKVGKEQR
jgi:serine/threonine protein kinase